MTEVYDTPETSSDDMGLTRLFAEGVKSNRAIEYMRARAVSLGNKLLDFAGVQPQLVEAPVRGYAPNPNSRQ